MEIVGREGNTQIAGVQVSSCWTIEFCISIHIEDEVVLELERSRFSLHTKDTIVIGGTVILGKVHKGIVVDLHIAKNGCSINTEECTETVVDGVVHNIQSLDVGSAAEIDTVTALCIGLVNLSDSTSVPGQFIGIIFTAPFIVKSFRIACNLTAYELDFIKTLSLSGCTVLQLPREAEFLLVTVEFNALEDEACTIGYSVEYLEFAHDYRLFRIHAFLSDDFNPGSKVSYADDIRRTIHLKKEFSTILCCLLQSCNCSNLGISISIWTSPDAEITTVCRLEIDGNHIVGERFQASDCSSSSLNLFRSKGTAQLLFRAKYTPFYRVNLRSSSLGIPADGNGSGRPVGHSRINGRLDSIGLHTLLIDSPFRRLKL